VIRLGHIVYSNCFPVHARLLEGRELENIDIVRGTPAELNHLLASGAIDVAPCSSIEFARHSADYRILEGLAIASRGPVQSILLETEKPLERLGGQDIAVASASATSAVLLRTLLEKRYDVRARFRWFDQESDTDPFASGASAALRIGDVALLGTAGTGRYLIDLGEAWTDWTGLPFVYAVWQTRLPPARDDELLRLRDLLLESLAWFEANAPDLAERRGREYGVPSERLLAYWRALCYRLDAPAISGLMRFYELAAELGEAPPVRSLSLLPA